MQSSSFPFTGSCSLLLLSASYLSFLERKISWPFYLVVSLDEKFLGRDLLNYCVLFGSEFFHAKFCVTELFFIVIQLFDHSLV